MEIKIAVVIPTYKRPDLLIRCLRSLLLQTLNKADFEVIVVSDGTDHDTHLRLLPWLKKRKLQLSYLQTPVKKGPAAARNMGWLSSRAPFIAFTDDDCLPDKNWLTELLNYFNTRDAMAISGKTHVPITKPPTDFAWNLAQLENAEFITANCACTKQLLFQTGGFDEQFKLAWREDSDLHFKLLKLNIPVIKAPEAIVIHPVRAAPWGISIKEQKKGIYDALLFKKFPDLYRSRINPRPLWNYYLINLLWMTLVLAILLKIKWLSLISAVILLILLGHMISRRLQNKSKTISHLLEMVSTSIVIPILSIYWRIYGSIKYNTFFL